METYRSPGFANQLGYVVQVLSGDSNDTPDEINDAVATLK